MSAHNLPFELPRPPGATGRPVWTGRGFDVDGEKHLVLAFSDEVSGWDTTLTDFQEATAGAGHFIDKASRSNAVRMVKKYRTVTAPVILEVGSSSGFLLRDLVVAIPEAVIIGSDATKEPLERLAATIPQVPLLQFDLVRCPLPDCSIDAVVLLNVLEHIERDDLAVAQVSRILSPDGVMIVEVPADPGLFDIYNELMRHRRRYDMASLETLTEQAGLQTVFRSHLGFFLYPPFWLAKKRNRWLLRGMDRNQRRVVASSINETMRLNAIGTALARMESRLRDLIYLPFGIRCLLVCRKRMGA